MTTIVNRCPRAKCNGSIWGDGVCSLCSREPQTTEAVAPVLVGIRNGLLISAVMIACFGLAFVVVGNWRGGGW